MKQISFVLLIILAAQLGACSQANETFTYNNKPITPEALLPFLPGMEEGDTVTPMIVNLKDSVYKQPVTVSKAANNDTWYDCSIEHNDYGAQWTESINYRIIAKTPDNKFITLIYSNGGGTLTIPYVFVFKVIDQKIYKLGYFVPEPLYLNPTEKIQVKGSEIINGKIHYQIPR